MLNEDGSGWWEEVGSDVDEYGTGRTGLSVSWDLVGTGRWFDVVSRWVGLGRVGGRGLGSGKASG